MDSDSIENGVKEEDVVCYANELLSKCNIDFAIEESTECTSDLFLAIYHAILGDFPSGTLIECSSDESQIHNVRCIVETLSSDYLKVDLSHISPDDVVKGEIMSIYNLFEILDGLLDYLLEKIGMDSDSGDEGDIDSDQLSDHARTMALQTIQKEISRSMNAQSPSSTAELIALGKSLIADDDTLVDDDEFVPLEPQISLTPDISNQLDQSELSDHTLHATQYEWETEKKRVSPQSSISPSETDSFKALPSPSKDLNGITSTFAKMQMRNGNGDIGMKNIPEPEPYMVWPQPPMSPIVVSDSGASMDSESRRQALDVELDDEHTAFILREKSHIQHSKGESSASESVDVADGGARMSDSDDSLRIRRDRSVKPASKEKDWQAMLNNLQKTVEESKKIRQEYFSSGGLRTRATDTSDEYQASVGDETASTAETLNGSLQDHTPRRRKNVRFEDTVSTKTAKELKEFRQVLQKERQLQEEKNQILGRNYQDHLDEVRQVEDEKLDPLRHKVKEKERKVKGELQERKRGRMQKTRQRKNLTDATKWKSWLAPRKAKKSPPKNFKRESSPAIISSGLESIGEHDLLPKLLEEFPQLELPPATLNDMWHKQFRQMEQLTAASVDHKNKKRRSEMKLQESHLKHELLTSIMQKEHEHTRHLRDIRERAKQQKEGQRTLRERRLQTARVRRYYRDYHLQMRSRMMKRRTKEERIFKRLFEDGLEIQRARLRELRKYARDKREEQQKRQVDEIQSLENHYRDQFNILAETLATERNDLKIRDTAQAKLIRQMKRGLRQKMEKEISDLQDMITRDDDDVYFREIEADRIRRQLQLATYHAKFKD